MANSGSWIEFRFRFMGAYWKTSKDKGIEMALIDRVRRVSSADKRQENGQMLQPSIERQLLDECESMVRYASASGLSLPTSAVEIVRRFAGLQEMVGADSYVGENIDRLVIAHGRLSKTILPATPRSVRLLEEQKPQSQFGRILGPVRLIRQLMVFALLQLLTFVLILSLTNVAAIRNPIQNIIQTDSAWTALWTSLFYLSAAGLGAAFAGLFAANRSVSEGTFDLTLESSYWTMIVLGLIGGVLLAQVLPNDFEGLGELTKPLLALLGGFSAPAVYGILNRLVQTVEALVQGDSSEILAAQEKEAKARAQEESVQNRMQLAAKVVSLQEKIYKEPVSEEVKARVGRLLDDVLVGDLESMPLNKTVRLEEAPTQIEPEVANRPLPEG
jgi:hypothetical protein